MEVLVVQHHDKSFNIRIFDEKQDQYIELTPTEEQIFPLLEALYPMIDKITTYKTLDPGFVF